MPNREQSQRHSQLLGGLDEEVPDLAATLGTYAHSPSPSHAADEADEANLSFLRDAAIALEQDPEADPHRPSDARRSNLIDPYRDPRRATGQHIESVDGQRSAGGAASQTQTQTQTQTPPADSRDDLWRRERLQRVLARLNRIHDPTGTSSASAYGNRTPSPNRQRLYDWAPSHEEPAQEDTELDQILAELRRQQPDTHPDILRVLSQSQLDASRPRERDAPVPPPTTDQTDAVDRRERLRERRRRENGDWVSLRSRAVLQRARQEGSPSATESMLRYVMERERSGMSEEEERARGTGWFSPAGRSGNEQHRGGNPSREPWPLPPSASEIRARTLQERAEVMQRRHPADFAPPRLPRISTPPAPVTSTPSAPSSQFLESALKYLDQLRSCYRYEEALSAAIDHGLATKEFFADKHDDFVMDLEEVNPIAGSSWLQEGTVFEGHQHATAASPGLLQSRPTSSSSHSMEQINPNYRNQGVGTTTGFDHPPASTRIHPFDATRPWISHQFTPPYYPAPALQGTKPSDSSHDHWPVRVIIHAVDPDRMTLQGTMEAYDVPQHPASFSSLNSTDRPKAGKKNAPITTYLEGHIIDLATHPFLTPSASEAKRMGPHSTATQNATPYTTLSDAISFPSANAHTDAANWRKLPPFNALPSDEETARCLLSKARMDEIHEEFIFMRWKERCFVHGKNDKCSETERAGDQDRGHGLTISGFYYVSLKRSNGAVEGLYFDPTSTPYQHLRLKGQRTGWPAFEFR
ncbi:Hypothetical predicted protein [Lecanosticta acicola]|uniref:Vacuolar import and degradation protein-domain-containing protein n=1 Tax=Lecanosticta acicola TaxID=111012 RepID=A0AAI8Z2Z3_9PEZI|nr:Hypothetical predicted protein [Lecanosticta acicola]